MAVYQGMLCNLNRPHVIRMDPARTTLPRKRVHSAMSPTAKHFCWIAGLLCAFAFSQADPRRAKEISTPEAEFHMARVKYAATGGGGSRGYFQPYWAIDYPLAEEHFTSALRRLTRVSVVTDSVQLTLSDARIFNYPFLFLQQPGKGHWRPTEQDATNLREYLLRGGFLLVDDFHGDYEWAVFQTAMQEVFPDRPIVDIPPDDVLMNIVFTTDQNIPLPGKRHLGRGRDGEVAPYMEGPPHWRGVYDDNGRVMVAINFNSDMGDAWEHEDDPYYPLPMTTAAHQRGINYVIYTMTH
jgi:hypothetical protein